MPIASPTPLRSPAVLDTEAGVSLDALEAAYAAPARAANGVVASARARRRHADPASVVEATTRWSLVDALVAGSFAVLGGSILALILLVALR